MIRASNGLSYCYGKERESNAFQRLLPPLVHRPVGYIKKELELDPYVNIGPVEIIRIIPVEELATSDYYSDIAELAVIFNHDVVETEYCCWRWKPNAFIDWIKDYAGVYTPAGPVSTAKGDHSYGQHCKSIRASLSLNTLACDLQCGAFSMEEWMKFYMQIGYSLCGFAECFGQHEASEYGLPGAKQRNDEDDPDRYVETVIEYMARVHKGKVLKL